MSSYLIDIIILLVAAVVAVPLAQALKLGAVPGFLIAGVVVGPHGLGLISNIRDIGNLAEIGVVFLLFVIGVELRPTRLWQMRRLVFGLGLLQVMLTGVLLGAVAHVFLDIPLRAAILVGPALALSSTAFVLQLLSEKKLLTSVYGRTSISVLLLQDLAVVPLLALVPLLSMPELSIGEDIGLALLESLLILVLVVFLGRYLLHPILHRMALSGTPEIFTASAMLIVLGTALATEHAGLSMAMGAFLAGLLISDSAYKHQIMAEIQPFRGFLLGLFFMSMGMSLNLGLLAGKPALAFGMLGLLLLVKMIVLFPLAYLFKLKLRVSVAAALLLSQSGEFALVLFSLANESKLLSDALFQQLLLVVLLSMLVTPVLADWAYRIVRTRPPKNIDTAEKPVTAPIVIAGFGRVGRRVGEILSIAGKAFVALDSDVETVEHGRANGYPVFYGDVQKPEVLRAAGAADARVILVTLNDTDATAEVVSSLRETYPDVIIYVRVHSSSQLVRLHRLGASGAASENVEASLELARMVLLEIGFDTAKQEAIIEEFREKYRAQIDKLFEVDRKTDRSSLTVQKQRDIS
jgi:monovalent cation:proton antiporter-2 (CPA2) family protein